MLSINLQKGEKVDLTKQTETLAKVFVACGWDVKNNGPTMDADLMGLLLTSDGTVRDKKDFIYYGNKGTKGDAIWHSGDNLTGAGDGDDEVINIDLTKVPDNIVKITFLLNIYMAEAKHQALADLDNAFIRVVDAGTDKELCKLDVNGMTGTTLTFGHLINEGGSWHFHADGATSAHFNDVIATFGLAA